MIAKVEKEENGKDEYSNPISNKSKNKKKLDLNNLLVRLRKNQKHAKFVKIIIFLALSVISVPLILWALNIYSKIDLI